MQIFKIPNKKKKRTHKILNFKGLRGTRTNIKTSYLIKSISPKGTLFTFNQLTSFRKKVVRFFKPRGLSLKWRIFPNYPFTHKPLGMRMGKGKGSPSSSKDWKADCRRGRIIFAIDGKISYNRLQEIILQASYKLPKIKIKLFPTTFKIFKKIKKFSPKRDLMYLPLSKNKKRIKR